MSETGDTPAGFEPIKSSNPFGALVGPIFEKLDDNGWVRGFRARPDVCNSGGFVHGGMLMTFADIVLARAVMDVAEPPFATVRLLTDFMAPAPQNTWVEGRAEVSRRTRALAFVEGNISISGSKIALISATFRLLNSR